MSKHWPDPFFEGVRRFNAGEYFEAHEAFEECMDDVEADDRWDLCLALVQVAVGYHKAASGHVGAERMLGLGLAKLEPFASQVHGVAVGALRDRVTRDLATSPVALDPADPPRLELR